MSQRALSTSVIHKKLGEKIMLLKLPEALSQTWEREEGSRAGSGGVKKANKIC